jgi:DNA helicase II / ATP-dependent DNA helicase PcrA
LLLSIIAEILIFIERRAPNAGKKSQQMGIGQLDLPWAGTFHAIGARILREYAHRIGLKPTFTILDRSDAADLMDVARRPVPDAFSA